MSTTVPGRFVGRTIIVTGAGSGIGRATTERLLAEGARVVGSDVVADRLDAVAAELDAGDRFVTVAGDVSDQAAVDAILVAAGSQIHGLANVAGIMDAFLPIGEVDDETWDRVLRVNVTGVMKLSRAVVPVMVAGGGGSVVNISSEAGLRGSAAGAAYTTSKHAVVGLTRHTAVMYGPAGVRANAVAPGGVATGIEAPFKSEAAAQRLGPLLAATAGAPASAEQLAAAITWLLSDDSLNVNGAILPSDGGWSAV